MLVVGGFYEATTRQSVRWKLVAIKSNRNLSRLFSPHSCSSIIFFSHPNAAPPTLLLPHLEMPHSAREGEAFLEDGTLEVMQIGPVYWWSLGNVLEAFWILVGRIEGKGSDVAARCVRVLEDTVWFVLCSHGSLRLG